MGILYRIDDAAPSLNNGDVGQVIATRVRDWRLAHNAAGEPRAAHEDFMTQGELAKRAGVGIGTIQGVERALRRARTKSLTDIAKAMGITLTELTEGDTDERPVVVADPRGKDLRDEDYEIARLFRTASTDVKLSVRNQLRLDALGLAAGLPIPPELNRRTGRDRRDSANDRLAVGPIDAAAEEEQKVTALVERLRRRLRTDPAFMATLEKHLALLEAHPTAKPDAEKKSGSTQSRRA